MASLDKIIEAHKKGGQETAFFVLGIMSMRAVMRFDVTLN